MYLVFLYDKYFLSYRKISYFFSAFQQTRQKTHLFCDYSKSNCRIAKPSTWLKSAFDSGKNEYDIIKIGEIFYRIFCPILKFSKSILLEKILALSEKNFFFVFLIVRSNQFELASFLSRKSVFLSRPTPNPQNLIR